MGHKRVSGAAGRDHRGRLKITERQRIYYLTGTLRAGRRSCRIRESTGIDSHTPAAWELANAIRIRRETEILDALVHGRAPAVAFASVAADYLEKLNPGAADLRNLDELLGAFALTPAGDLDALKIEGFYRDRFPAHSPATIRRHMATLRAVLGHAVAIRALTAVPHWDRPKVPRRRGAAMLKMFFPGEGELLIACAAPHARPIMAVQYATGAKTGSVIHLLREHFILTPGRGRVFFPETKNRNSYSRPLPDYAVEILDVWLAARRDRFAEMFLTDRRRPYVRRLGHGGHIADAFRTARDTAAGKLIEMDMEDRARVIAQATPHWWRHNLANRLRRDKKWDAKKIAEAGMWEDTDVVEQNYLGDESDEIETGLRSLTFGTILTQPAKAKDTAS